MATGLTGPILAFPLSLGNACHQLSVMTLNQVDTACFGCFKWPLLLVQQPDCYKHCSQDRQEVLEN